MVSKAEKLPLINSQKKFKKKLIVMTATEGLSPDLAVKPGDGINYGGCPEKDGNPGAGIGSERRKYPAIAGDNESPGVLGAMCGDWR